MFKFRKLSLPPALMAEITQEGVIKHSDLMEALSEIERAETFMQKTMSKCETLLAEAEREANEIVRQSTLDAEDRYHALENTLLNNFHDVIQALHTRQRDIEAELHETYSARMRELFSKIFDGADFREKTEIMLFQLTKYSSTLRSGVFLCSPAQKAVAESWLHHHHFTGLSVEVDADQQDEVISFLCDDAKYSVSWDAFTAIFK